MPQTSHQTTVNDNEIRAFTAAATEVQQVKQRWIPKLQAAARQGPDAQQTTQQQAMQEMTQVVQKNGLSVDKYNQIADLAESDPEVQRRVENQMQEEEPPAGKPH